MYTMAHNCGLKFSADEENAQAKSKKSYEIAEKLDKLYKIALKNGYSLCNLSIDAEKPPAYTRYIPNNLITQKQ